MCFVKKSDSYFSAQGFFFFFLNTIKKKYYIKFLNILKNEPSIYLRKKMFSFKNFIIFSMTYY